jgi:peptidoglycan/LPS O-acetylase OafA/YrhL
MGVTIFFFLSGYLITSLIRVEFEETGVVSLKAFYKRRAARLLAPLFITLAIGYSLQAANIPDVEGTFRGFVSVLFYFYNYASLISGSDYSLPAGLTVLWSLMIEEHFYFIFPCLYMYALRKRVSRTRQIQVLAAACLVAMCWRLCLVFMLRSSLTEMPRWTYNATDTRFDSIVWGCLLAVAWNSRFDQRLKLNPRLGAFALLALGTLAGTLVWRDPIWRESVRYTIQGIALLPVFYYCLSKPHSVWVRWLEFAPLCWIGWMSYTMYLSHEMVIDCVEMVHPNGIAVNAAISFSVTVLFGYGMRALVELPLKRALQLSRNLIMLRS